MSSPRFYHSCREILLELMQHENSYYFLKPVNPDDTSAPDYYKKNPRPMCFFMIQEKLDNNEYKTPEEFVSDVNAIWQNAKNYNGPHHSISHAADQLSRKFETLLTTLPRTITGPSLNTDLQRYIELRFGRYQMNKTTHE